MDRYLFRRYVLFVLSLFINALGVAFITKALLGTSPITSVNYVLSMFTPLTMGQWTILLNLTFVLLDLLFMTREDLRRERTSYLLQIPISLSFGLFIDCAMLMLFWLEPVAYAAKLLWLIVGCFILAAGIALEVRVNVAMTAGEYLVQVICRRHHFDFGYTKLAFDLTLVLLACLLSYLFMSDIRGVREGTVVAALAVGPIVHFLTPCFRQLDHWTGLDGAAGQGTAAAPDADHAVITIAREFGSGGHRLGELLARELHLPLYDRQFIRLAAQKSGVDERYIVENEQSIPSFWLKCILSSGTRAGRGLSTDDVLFVAESKIVQELAAKGPCIIVGRCADFVLRSSPRVLRIFCCCDRADAVARCVEEYDLPESEAEAEIERVNRNRSNHYEFYTGQRWSDPHHYDLMVNTGHVSLEAAAALIRTMYRERCGSAKPSGTK